MNKFAWHLSAITPINEHFLRQTVFKGNAQFVILCNPQKSLVNVCLMKLLKSTVTKQVIMCFYNLGEKNF